MNAGRTNALCGSHAAPELEDLYRYIIHDSKLEEIASTNYGNIIVN